MYDLVQEVFIWIHAKLATLERPEALRSWIYSIVRRTVSTHRRAQRARTQAGLGLGTTVSVGELASSEPTPLDETEKRADVALLWRLLDELDAQKREVFKLIELEELSVPEAAEILDIPLNTAYSRLRAARQAFEMALARYEARSKHK